MFTEEETNSTNPLLAVPIQNKYDQEIYDGLKECLLKSVEAMAKEQSEKFETSLFGLFERKHSKKAVRLKAAIEAFNKVFPNHHR